ncbi:MAG: PAS domain-containing protein, partial [Verrucomicrobia bacterium]|nr:PAS domain-containing protein [Verrucomicrobiota bacterium]
MSRTGSWVWDVRRAAPVYWSPEMCRFHGVDPSNGPPSSEAYRALHRPEDWSNWMAAVEECVACRADIQIDSRLMLPDSSVKRLRINGRPIAANGTKITEIIGSATELGGSDDEASDLRSEEHFRQMINLIPAPAWSSGPDGSVDFLNQSWLNYTGLSMDEARNWGWMATFHPDDVRPLVEYWNSLLAAGEPGAIEARLRRFDGEYRWCHILARPLRDKTGAVCRWYGSNTDVEDRRRAEDALRGRERELRQLVETIPALIWRRSATGELDYVNQRLTDYLGESLDRIGFDVVHPEDRDQYRSKFADSLQTGKAWEDTCRLRRADGQYRWFQVRVEPLRDHDGRVIHWYAVNLDIHEGRELEETLRLTRNRLASAIQIATVAELSASIAHEINQPLASIAANGQACVAWLAADPPNLPRAQLTADRIIRDANAAAEVVRRIRALFKQTAPAMVPSEINAIVDEVLRLMAEEIRYCGISTDTDLAARLPLIVV